MTDLISLTDISTQLQSQSETRLLLSDAYRLIQGWQATYEADRVASAAAQADLSNQVATLTAQAVSQTATVNQLQTDNAAKSNTIDSLTAQVAALTAQVATLTQTDNDLTGKLATDETKIAADATAISDLTAQSDALTKSNTDLTSKLSADDASIVTIKAQLATLTPDVTVTVGTNSVISRTVPAVSFVEQKPLWTLPAWPTMKQNIASCVGAEKIHIYPFGLLEPQPTPTSPIDLTTSARLIPGLARLREVSPTYPIILTIYGAEWWQKHNVFSNAITDLTSADAYSDQGRVKYIQLPKFLAIVDVAVAAAAAQGCRDFELWNEVKGWYDVYPHVGQKWDMTMNPGNTTQNPVMGFSYFGQQVINQVVATMTRIGISRDQYRITAPYMPFRSQGLRDADSIAPTHPLYQYNTTWGYLNKVGDNGIKDYLANAKANNFLPDVIGIDMATGNKDNVYATTDPFALNAKFTHMLNYLRSIFPTYGLDPDIAIDFDELYPFPQPQYRDANSEPLRAAMWADCLRQCVLGRVRYPIIWGATASNVVSTINPNGDYGNLGGLVAADGTLQKVGKVFQMYKENFAPGTKAYPLITSDNTVGGTGSDSVVILHNQTNAPRKVTMDGDVYLLDAYDVRKIVR